MYLNIFEKLQNMRVELQGRNIKKSGKNKYSGYDYFELSDFLPSINELQLKYKTCSVLTFTSEMATLTFINSEKTDEKVEFTCPMTSISLKGAHDVQNMGALQTYYRRYLYLTSFDIVEHEFFDAIQGKDQTYEKTPSQVKRLTDKTRRLLNSAIMEYSRLSKISIDDIVSDLTNVAKKELVHIGPKEAELLLNYLNSKINSKRDMEVVLV